MGAKAPPTHLHDIVHDLLHVERPHHVRHKLRVGVRLANLGVQELADRAGEFGAAGGGEGREKGGRHGERERRQKGCVDIGFEKD